MYLCDRELCQWLQILTYSQMFRTSVYVGPIYTRSMIFKLCMFSWSIYYVKQIGPLKMPYFQSLVVSYTQTPFKIQRAKTQNTCFIDLYFVGIQTTRKSWLFRHLSLYVRVSVLFCIPKHLPPAAHNIQYMCNWICLLYVLGTHTHNAITCKSAKENFYARAITETTK